MKLKKHQTPQEMDRPERFGFPYFWGIDEEPDPTIGRELPAEFYSRHAMVPLRKTETGEVVVAIADPMRTLPLDIFNAIIQKPIRIICAPTDEIQKAILKRSASSRETTRQILATEPGDRPEHPASSVSGDVLISEPDHPVVIRLVNTLIADAMEFRASDIHLEPERDRLRVRYRIDGLLQDMEHPAAHLRDLIISRIKVLARMELSHRMTPQDGQFSVTWSGHPVDIRVSSVPTPTGDRMVLRLLGARGDIDLETLGMPDSMIAEVDRILSQPQGLFIVAGPTGSGKTTTLYACLKRIDTHNRNTITVEDPVEYELQGISQIHVNGSRKLTFASGLRSLLRQDPDVIMVGEIRDGETAGMALQSALTGHLILTTIHTGDPSAAVIRLLDLGVDPALIAETVTAIMDQRLIRRLCGECARVVHGTARRPIGCSRCRHTGFSGRIGLFRLLHLDDDFRYAIRQGDHARVKELAGERCGNQLIEQAQSLIDTGWTTPEEVQRVWQERS